MYEGIFYGLRKRADYDPITGDLMNMIRDSQRPAGPWVPPKATGVKGRSFNQYKAFKRQMSDFSKESDEKIRRINKARELLGAELRDSEIRRMDLDAFYHKQGMKLAELELLYDKVNGDAERYKELYEDVLPEVRKANGYKTKNIILTGKLDDATKKLDDVTGKLGNVTGKLDDITKKYSKVKNWGKFGKLGVIGAGLGAGLSGLGLGAYLSNRD